MPKGKKKGKFEHRRTEQVDSSDEDAGIDMTNDNYSETSGQSDLKSQEEVENELQEKFEEKVLELIDGLTARSNAARAQNLVSLRSALQRRHLSGLLSNHRVTLADHVAKMLRRGKDGEKKAAAGIAPLLALQIGEDGEEEYVAEVRPALAAAAVDKSASLDTRTECCSSLAVLCYLLEEDLTEIVEVMRMYETIFSGSYLKGDGSVKVAGAAAIEGSLHAAALDGWSLLFPLLPAQHATALLNTAPPGLGRLAHLLHACCLEVRLAAGGALAIVSEHIWDSDSGEDSARDDHISLLLPRLEELSRDSNKFRAKKDRKLQRATFRDLLKYFQEDWVPSLSVRVSSHSTLQCDTWWSRAAYSSLAASLGAGLQTLAPHNTSLRAALGLDDEPLTSGPKAKLNKLQRHLQNSAACKARTLARNKSRDKRAAALAM